HEQGQNAKEIPLFDAMISLAETRITAYVHGKPLGAAPEAIPPAPRGVPQIEVAFDIDANGIVSVSAKDKGTGKEQKITIQASGGLSDEDIEAMVREAEENAEADKEKKEMVEARNAAESLIHSTEKSVEEHGEKVDPTTVEVIEMSIVNLKEALEGDDAEAIKVRSQDVTEAAMKLGEAIYKEQQEAAEAEAATAEDGVDDSDVVDADFEDLDEEDKA
ncbi:MAG: Hsp70 family protein, partial [Paracoccaceae bacterium]